MGGGANARGGVIRGRESWVLVKEASRERKEEVEGRVRPPPSPPCSQEEAPAVPARAVPPPASSAPQ